MTFRKTVAASVAALCLINSTQVPSASAATVSYQDKKCTVTLTNGDVSYTLTKAASTMYESDSFKNVVEEQATKLKAAVATIKGLLSNKETQPETQEFLQQLEKVAADPNATKESVPSTEELFAKLPDDLFIGDNDPTKGYEEYSGWNSKTWKVRAQSALSTYARDTVEVTTMLATIKKLEQNDPAALKKTVGDQFITEENWNTPLSTIDAAELESSLSAAEQAKISGACAELSKAGSGKKEVALAPSYDEYVSTTAKEIASTMLKMSQPVIDVIAASKQELNIKLDLPTPTPTPEKTSPDSKTTEEKTEPEKSGFNWKLLLIILAVLGAVGAAAYVTMMPKPPVA